MCLLHGRRLHSLPPGFPMAWFTQSQNTFLALASGVLAVKLKAKTPLPPTPHTFTAPHLPPLQGKPPPLGSPARHFLLGPGGTIGLFYMFFSGFLYPCILTSSVLLHHCRPLESICHPSVSALCIQRCTILRIIKKKKQKKTPTEQEMQLPESTLKSLCLLLPQNPVIHFPLHLAKLPAS